MSRLSLRVAHTDQVSPRRHLLGWLLGAALVLSADTVVAAPTPHESLGLAGKADAELVRAGMAVATSPQRDAQASFRDAMLHSSHWTLPGPDAPGCVFSQNTRSMSWNDQANFAMKLQGSGTTVTAVGSSSIKIKCAGSTKCITGKGSEVYQNERTIPVAQGKASKAVSSIAEIRSLVPSCD